MIKRTSFLLMTIIITAALFCTTCAKIDKDQPCGTYGTNNQQLFKDSSGNCYYIDDNSGKHIYVTNTNCSC